MDRPTWVQADETKPAPMPLLLVQAFVNTFEADHNTDQLLGRSGASWLEQCGLVDDARTVTDDDLERLRSAREAIRSLLEANGEAHGRTASSRDRGDPSARLATLAGAGRLRPTVDPDGGVTLLPDAGTDGAATAAVVRLLVIARDAQRDGTWDRLKVCGNDECRWAYFDRSHAIRGRWCEMAVCGNRVKNRALRARQR
jgi:predicted RNA-binding Zn ribbon-like protein